jgi:hypothetical protein
MMWHSLDCSLGCYQKEKAALQKLAMQCKQIKKPGYDSSCQLHNWRWSAVETSIGAQPTLKERAVPAAPLLQATLDERTDPTTDFTALTHTATNADVTTC